MKKLTPFAKILIGVLVLAIVGTGVFKLGLFNPVLNKSKTEKQSSTGVESVQDTNNNVTKAGTTPTSLRISLDEWIGWKPLIDANGGLKTADGSEMAKRGLNVEFVIINDGTQSSNALIKGDLAGAGYTINRTAFLMDKFVKSGVDVTMPFISNYSNGGDGIIAKDSIQSVNDLVGKKVGVPRFSEAQTLVEWLIQKSDLTEDQIAQIEMVYFDTPDDAAKAFFAGQVDASATWQPYLQQATETSGAHILFSTKSATNLILDGILFRKDFVDANEDTIVKFIDACLSSYGMYKTEFGSIKSAMPLFAMETDNGIIAMAETADLCSYTDNVKLLDGLAREVYVDMSSIWDTVGQKMGEDIVSHPEMIDIFDSKYVKQLESSYASIDVTSAPIVTQKDVVAASNQESTQALLQKSVQISFEPNSAVFLNADEAMATLNEFIQIAQTLNGAVIRIEGNVADTGGGNEDAERMLSEQRAQTVAKYLAQNGVDPNRFVVVGNGTSKPIGDNGTEEGMAQNRRTDIYFFAVE